MKHLTFQSYERARMCKPSFLTKTPSSCDWETLPLIVCVYHAPNPEQLHYSRRPQTLQTPGLLVDRKESSLPLNLCYQLSIDPEPSHQIEPVEFSFSQIESQGFIHTSSIDGTTLKAATDLIKRCSSRAFQAIVIDGASTTGRASACHVLL